MPIDRAAAESFIWSAARLVDRHRYAVLFGDGAAEPVVAALAAYRNADGGFGHALEPDVRCPQSQPPATLYALEMLQEAGRLDTELVDGAVRWLESISAADGGIPFVRPGYEGYPHAPWYAGMPHEDGSFLTFGFAAVLTPTALPRATEWSWNAIEQADSPSPYWLKYALAFLDAAPDEGRARAAVERLRPHVDPEALMPEEGAEGERLRPLDLSPRPRRPTRGLFGEELVAAHLDEVEAGQLEDGGWMFDWRAWSPAQSAAWRGNVTIRALTWLRDNGRAV